MMIGKFNRLTAKHGRWLFGVITVFIAVAFVGMTTFMGSMRAKGDRNTVIATVFGNKIKNSDRQRRAVYSIINICFSSPSMFRFIRMFEQQAFQTSIQDLIYLQAATEIGVRASNKEVVDYIKSAQSMQTTGKFDKKKYDKFVDVVKKKFGMTSHDVEESIRQALTLKKLQSYITANVVVTDGEAKAHYNNLYTKISAMVARFNSEDYKDDVSVTENMLKEYFKTNKKAYMTPEEYDVVIAKFNYVAFEDEAKKDISDKEILSYYNAHKDKYMKDGKQQSLDEVKALIISRLAKYKSEKLAFDKANVFANQVYSDIENLETKKDKINTFITTYNEFTKGKFGECIDIDWFKNGATKIPKVGTEPNIAVAASKIYEEIPISDPVSGKRAAFVIFLKDKKEKGYSTLEAVHAKVMSDYTSKEALVVARNAAKDLAAKLTASSEAGTKFAEIKGVDKFKSIKPFTLNEMPDSSVADRAVVAQLAGNTENNKFSAAKNTPDGSVIVYVEKRIAPPAKEFESKKVQMEKDVANIKKQAAWADFYAWLNKNVKIL